MGYFGFKQSNGYTFVSVDSAFAYRPLEVLADEDFRVRYTIRKNHYPGKIFND